MLIRNKEIKINIKEPSFFLCLLRVYGAKFFSGALLKLIRDLLVFVGPYILKYFILNSNDSF